MKSRRKITSDINMREKMWQNRGKKGQIEMAEVVRTNEVEGRRACIKKGTRKETERKTEKQTWVIEIWKVWG